MTYRLSREAGFDLDQIYDYTADTWGEAQAERYVRDIFAALERLDGDPGLGRRREDIPRPYLAYGVGGHLIIYRRNDAEGRVEVLNILHPAMNIGERLMQALKRSL